MSHVDPLDSEPECVEFGAKTEPDLGDAPEIQAPRVDVDHLLEKRDGLHEVFIDVCGDGSLRGIELLSQRWRCGGQ